MHFTDSRPGLKFQTRLKFELFFEAICVSGQKENNTNTNTNTHTHTHTHTMMMMMMMMMNNK